MDIFLNCPDEKRGETATVNLQIAKEDLMLWNRKMEKVLEPGEFEVYIGSSVEDIRLKETFFINQ